MMENPNNFKIDSLQACTILPNGTILLHSGDISDLQARDWKCPDDYLNQFNANWNTMKPLYDAAYGVGLIPNEGLTRQAYEAYDALVASLGKLPSTALLIDACCALAKITLLPMERLWHIRSIKERHAIRIT